MREYMQAKNGQTRYARDGSAIMCLGTPSEVVSFEKACEVRKEQRAMSRLKDKPLCAWPRKYRAKQRSR